jgi:predicted Rossmann fold flavoprotein
MDKKPTFLEHYDVIVVGGGPAGMMAAGYAGIRGRSTLLLEKNEKLGKKLLISGGGRCNITNNKQDVRVMLAKYKGKGKFLFSAFSQFSVKDSISFFEHRGVTLKEENEGRMFPTTNKAQTVWDALVNFMKEGGVQVHTRSGVSGIEKDAEDFILTLRSGEVLRAKTCVVATGGTSHPETGSTGEGYEWLAKLGHTVVPNNFALVPIALKDVWVKSVSGVGLKDAKLTMFSDGKKQSVYTGKLLFTHFGISGPLALNMSKEVGDALAHSTVTLHLDLFPSHDSHALRLLLQDLLSTESNKKLKNVLTTLLPGALVSVLLEHAKIDGETPSHSVRSVERVTLITLLKAVPLTVKSLLGKDKAVISAGGVALTEVNMKTMESKVVPNLYLIGDVLDIDRPSGGYSLQLCWTQGFVAGNNV